MSKSKFHEHLDGCERCRMQPFNLCEDGARLLRITSDEAINGVRDRLGADGRLGAVETEGDGV